MKENAISASIMKWLRTLPFTVAWKVTDPNNVGFPDIVGAYRGIVFFFEVKQKAGTATKKQVYEIERIRAAGGRARVVYGLDQVQQAMIEWFGIEPIYCTRIRKSYKEAS